MRVTECFS